MSEQSFVISDVYGFELNEVNVSLIFSGSIVSSPSPFLYLLDLLRGFLSINMAAPQVLELRLEWNTLWLTSYAEKVNLYVVELGWYKGNHRQAAQSKTWHTVLFFTKPANQETSGLH